MIHPAAHPLERISTSADGYVGAGGLDLSTGRGQMPIAHLERFLSEIRHQPHWRYQADVCADYYDGNQLTPQQVAELEELNLPPLIINLIAPTVDLVLGMEERARRDWVVRSETEGGEDVALALTEKLKIAERMTKADRACSDAYAAQIKTGVHWVGVSRPMDPFQGRMRVEAVHRREMWWDWRAKCPLLTDARWLMRKQWYDMDVLVAAFPRHKDLLLNAVTGRTWAEWDWSRAIIEPLLTRDYYVERDTTIEELEWRETERKRLALYEVWYKNWTRGHVLDLPDGVVIEFKRDHPLHRQLVLEGHVFPRAAMIPKIRLSWWCGPYRLEDVPNPFPFDGFPYVPFYGKREDRTGVPYGIVRAMKPMQDEVNARRIRMLWLLSAKRVIADDDAVMGKAHDAVRKDVNKPTMYVKLNPDRRNKDAAAFRIEQDFQLSAQQFSVMEHSAEMIQATAGVYQEMLGSDPQGKSGIAIANLVEQGTTTLAEVNANYQLARARVGQLLMLLVKEEMEQTGEQRIKVREKFSSSYKTIVVNQIEVDESGREAKTNEVARVRASVALDEVPSTVTFRAQQLQQLAEIVKPLPDELQAAVLDIVIEATDLPDKDIIADRIRKLTGQNVPRPEELDEQELEQYEAEQAEQQQAAELAKAGAEAEVLARQAEARKHMAEADKVAAEARQIGVDDGTDQQAASLKLQLEELKQEHSERLTAMANALKEHLAEMQSESTDRDRALKLRQMVVDTSLELLKMRQQAEQAAADRRTAQAVEEREGAQG